LYIAYHLYILSQIQVYELFGLDFIQKNISPGGKKEVGIHNRLLEDRIIDSLGLLEVITFLENTFRITVNDEDVILEKFATISSISDYVIESINTNL